MLWVTVLLVTSSIRITYQFNLENRLPIYKFDSQLNSYFGYSVAIHHEGENDKNGGRKW